MKKWLRIVLWSLGGLIAAVIIALCAITWYLTPERLSKIISREMSEYLNADVRVENARFTFWSTFPRFMLETDSIVIVSHSLDSLSPEELAALPGNPKLLASASSLKGGINVFQLLRGKYVMRDIDVSSLYVNIVAVNDSVNNYDILPKDTRDTEKIHFFTTNSLKLTNARGIDIFFAQSGTNGHIDLHTLSMERMESDTDSEYDLRIGGEVSAKTGDLVIFNKFPFSLHGDLGLDFKPFKLKFQNFDIDLESIKSMLNMTVNMEGDSKIDSFDYRISAVNLFKLFDALPWLPMGNLRSVKVDLDVMLTAKLDRPYTFSSGELPYVTISADVDGNTIDYESTDNQTIPLTFSKITAGLHFNGGEPDKSRLFVDPFTVSSGESRMTLSASATRLLEHPDVTISFSGSSNLDYVSERFPELKKWEMEGILQFEGEAFGKLVSLKPEDLQKGVQDLTFSTRIDAEDLSFCIDGYDFKAAALAMDINSMGVSPDSDYPLDIPISIKAQGENACLKTPDGMTYMAPEIDAAVTLSGAKEIDDFKLSPVDLSAANFTLGFGDEADINLRDATASFGVVPAKSYLRGATKAPATHYLAVKAPAGELHVGFSKMANPLKDIDVYYNPDSIGIRSLGIRCLSTYASLKGTAVNLREFLHSGMKQPVALNLDIACDTIDINQIAHTYYRGSKTAQPKPAVASPADTIPILIPKGIDADIRLSAKESIYTNLHLFDLSGRVRIKDGVAEVKDFDIKADFGRATLGLTYNTADLQKMSVAVNAALLDINVEGFFSNFHTLLLMMPQMSNLKGMIDLSLSGGLELFPNMYINMPSLHADIGLKGWDLTVHQNHFIHRLARKLLIRGDHDLHIRNMDVQARVRDNLLELYPFDFDVENYHLRAEGTNNFNGNLYYHIDVMKSPIPFKFGVNVEGLFHDPKIRFGRAGYDQKKGEEITLMNEVYTHMNLVKEVKYYIKEFVRKAAESKGD